MTLKILPLLYTFKSWRHIQCKPSGILVFFHWKYIYQVPSLWNNQWMWTKGSTSKMFIGFQFFKMHLHHWFIGKPMVFCWKTKIFEFHWLFSVFPCFLNYKCSMELSLRDHFNIIGKERYLQWYYVPRNKTNSSDKEDFYTDRNWTFCYSYKNEEFSNTF